MLNTSHEYSSRLVPSHAFVIVAFLASAHVFETFELLIAGVLVGFVLHQFHVFFIENALEKAKSVTDFYYLYVSLCAKCAKADGVVTPEEIKMFKETVDIPHKYNADVSAVFDRARKSTQGYEAIAQKVYDLCAEGRRQDLQSIYEGLHYVAASNGRINEKQMSFLKVVGNLFKISATEQKAMRLSWGILEDGFVKDAEYKGSAGSSAMNVNGRSVYEILGVSKKAKFPEIRKAYREKLKVIHPDKLRGNGASEMEIKRAEHDVSDLTEAFEMLKSVLK